MADVARAKTVHSAIAASSARAASGDAALNDLIRQTQDTDQQLAAMSDMLKSILTAPADQQDQKAIQALRGDIAQAAAGAQDACAARSSGDSRNTPSWSIPSRSASPRRAPSCVDGDTLIATYFTGGKGYVWAIPKQGEVAFARDGGSGIRDRRAWSIRLHKAVNSEATLDQRDSAVRRRGRAQAACRAAGAGGAGLARREEHDRGAARHARPAAVLAAGHASRHAQPQEADGALRFAGYREVPFLVREVTVTHVPSVAAFVSLRSVPAGAARPQAVHRFRRSAGSARSRRRWRSAAAGRAAAAIQLAMAGAARSTMRAAPKTQGLPSAELRTAAAVARHRGRGPRDRAGARAPIPRSDVMLGSKASEKAVRSMKLDDRRVVMFATHGLIPGELDGLDPAGAGAGVAGDRGRRGRRAADGGKNPEPQARRRLGGAVGLQHGGGRGRRRGGGVGARPRVLLRRRAGASGDALAGRDGLGAAADDRSVPPPGGIAESRAAPRRCARP